MKRTERLMSKTAFALAAAAALLLGPAQGMAQMPLPAAAAPSGASLFRNQCATCHTLDASLPPRQGPTLAGVIGRRAGSVQGYHYSAGFAHADWTWDAPRIDRWITNPQAMIPGAVMPYHQANPATRRLIVQYLVERH